MSSVFDKIGKKQSAKRTTNKRPVSIETADSDWLHASVQVLCTFINIDAFFIIGVKLVSGETEARV